MKRIHREDKIQPTRHYSKAQEKRVASKFEGERTLNSGATPFQKGDVVIDKILVECKTKVKSSESMTIHKEWLEKNEKEALFMGKDHSVLAFNFGPNEKNYYIIDEYLFEQLTNNLRGVEND
jgi:hypothetical protein